ncbi:MAG: TrmO family methyltransferase domain-containing protein, partial [Candidatus Binataceae bacterium]
MKLQTIGHLRTPYRTLAECPSSPAEVTARTRIELLWKYLPALEEIEAASHLIVLYWLDAANRAVLRIATRVDGKVRGVFANRSPMRPNPIAIATVKLFELEAHTIVV